MFYIHIPLTWWSKGDILFSLHNLGPLKLPISQNPFFGGITVPIFSPSNKNEISSVFMNVHIISDSLMNLCRFRQQRKLTNWYSFQIHFIIIIMFHRESTAECRYGIGNESPVDYSFWNEQDANDQWFYWGRNEECYQTDYFQCPPYWEA